MFSNELSWPIHYLIYSSSLPDVIGVVPFFMRLALALHSRTDVAGCRLGCGVSCSP